MKEPKPRLHLEGKNTDVREELSFHFAQAIDELVRSGMTREAAEAETLRLFGDEPTYRRQLETMARAARRRRRGQSALSGVGHAARYAWRSILHSPGLSASVVLVFALGVGANATMFGILDRLLLSPPPHID
jgi:hypothetical protein